MTLPSDASSSGISEGLILGNLAPGSRVDVETKSRHYLIECLGGNAIRISGHPDLCPEPTAAHLQGSIDREGILDSGIIGRGKRLMFLLGDVRPVTTSKVLKVHVDRAPQPPSSTSIH
jgi:hypothetical protein